MPAMLLFRSGWGDFHSFDAEFYGNRRCHFCAVSRLENCDFGAWQVTVVRVVVAASGPQPARANDAKDSCGNESALHFCFSNLTLGHVFDTDDV